MTTHMYNVTIFFECNSISTFESHLSDGGISYKHIGLRTGRTGQFVMYPIHEK